jgi:hypothetical protein
LRRSFLKSTLLGGIGLLLPTILPARLFGAGAPGKKIHIAQIGCGRMGRSVLGNVLSEPFARIVALWSQLSGLKIFRRKQLILF